jgi:hypothetical protein
MPPEHPGAAGAVRRRADLPDIVDEVVLDFFG